jgi:hypothetical protein
MSAASATRVHRQRGTIDFRFAHIIVDVHLRRQRKGGRRAADEEDEAAAGATADGADGAS